MAGEKKCDRGLFDLIFFEKSSLREQTEEKASLRKIIPSIQLSLTFVDLDLFLKQDIIKVKESQRQETGGLVK